MKDYILIMISIGIEIIFFNILCEVIDRIRNESLSKYVKIFGFLFLIINFVYLVFLIVKRM